MIFIDYWKVLVLNFSEMRNTIFFWDKKLMEIWYWLITESSCFEYFGDGKYDLLFSQKVDGKMILIWSFWGFPDIQGLEKYGFPCDYSLISFILIYDKNQHKKTERNQNNNNKKLSYPNFGLPYQKRVITTATDILRRACYTELKFWVHIFIIDIYLL